MFCPNCGNQCENSKFCPKCGTPVTQENQTLKSEPTPSFQYQSEPVNSYQSQQPQINVTPSLPMGWYKFLINFAIFAGAVLNLVYGIQLLTGAHYGDGAADYVYAAFPDLKTVDMLTGFATLALAGFGVYVRSRLAGYYADGPKKLNLLYLGSLIVSVVYLFAAFSVLPDGIGESVDFSSYYVSVAISIAMVCANTTYFKNREDMFIN